MERHRRSATIAVLACGFLVVVTTLRLGGSAALDQLIDGGNETSGNVLLVTFAIIGTTGACIAYWAWQGHHRMLVGTWSLTRRSQPNCLRVSAERGGLAMRVGVLAGQRRSGRDADGHQTGKWPKLQQLQKESLND